MTFLTLHFLASRFWMVLLSHGKMCQSWTRGHSKELTWSGTTACQDECSSLLRVLRHVQLNMQRFWPRGQPTSTRLPDEAVRLSCKMTNRDMERLWTGRTVFKLKRTKATEAKTSPTTTAEDLDPADFPHYDGDVFRALE